MGSNLTGAGHFSLLYSFYLISTVRIFREVPCKKKLVLLGKRQQQNRFKVSFVCHKTYHLIVPFTRSKRLLGRVIDNKLRVSKKWGIYV